MANPICLSPLKFYDDIKKQNHRKNYAFGHVSPLIMPFNTLLPFQYVIPNDFSIEEIHLKSIDEKQDIDVYNSLKEYGFHNKNIENYNVVSFPGKFPIQDIKYEGEYYLEMKTNTAQEEIKTVKPILYWGIYNKDNKNTVYLNLQGYPVKIEGYPGSLFPNLNVKIVAEDDTEFNIPYPYQTLDFSVFAKEKPGCAGTFYDSDSQQFNHGPIVDVKITNENFQFIKVEKIDSWSEVDNILVDQDTGGILLDVEVPEKQYDTKIVEHGPYTYYSDVFCFTNALEDCLEIEYWNSVGNFYLKNGIVSFDDNFKFKLFLKSEIGKPEYNFEEESTKRLGYNFIESQVSKKIYKFNAVIPEFICDAMRIIRLCDNKIIKSKGEEYEAITFEMEAEWQTQGDLASVTCEFETDNVITNLGGFVPDAKSGDFSSDFNNDFKTN